jgi:hypothetical protein
MVPCVVPTKIRRSVQGEDFRVDIVGFELQMDDKSKIRDRGY